MKSFKFDNQMVITGEVLDTMKFGGEGKKFLLSYFEGKALEEFQVSPYFLEISQEKLQCEFLYSLLELYAYGVKGYWVKSSPELNIYKFPADKYTLTRIRHSVGGNIVTKINLVDSKLTSSYFLCYDSSNRVVKDVCVYPDGDTHTIDSSFGENGLDFRTVSTSERSRGVNIKEFSFTVKSTVGKLDPRNVRDGSPYYNAVVVEEERVISYYDGADLPEASISRTEYGNTGEVISKESNADEFYSDEPVLVRIEGDSLVHKNGELLISPK